MRICHTLAVFIATASIAAAAPGDEKITVTEWANFLGLTPPTPIAITGFPEETARILRFDLTVMGFTNVSPEAADIELSGSTSGNVQGQLSRGKAGARTVLFSRAYSGPSLRGQAHRLSDDTVMQLTGINGIAETRIAFKAASGRSSEIYVADFDGFDAQPVTQDHSIVAAPCWVPGHLSLFYTSYKSGYDNIFFQNLDSGERRNYSHYPGMNGSAAVSPDASMVATILGKTGRDNVFVSDFNGSNLRQLTDTHEFESSPCWSADGKWIYYASHIDGRRTLCKVSVNGGRAERVPTSGVVNPSEPDCSPDGQWIAFTSQMRDFSICVIPTESNHAASRRAVILVDGQDPSWAPNSRTLIFVRRVAGRDVLSLLDVPTKQVKDVSRVSGSDSNNSQPTWAR